MRPRVALTVAGSDPTGGAGIQGDLRAFAAFGVHGVSVITCVTAQGTRGVRDVFALEASRVRAQLDALLDDVRVDAIKTGALATAAIVRLVAKRAATLRAPLVVDPVIVATSGAALLDRRAVRVLRRELLPRAALVTPNVHELATLLEIDPPADARALRDAARALLASTGAKAILAKGGHLAGAPIDVLVDAHGARFFEGKRVEGRCTHGTGCTLASAIAAGLAHGRSLRVAVRDAKALVERGLRGAPIGPGKSPLDLRACVTCRRTRRASSGRARSRP